MQNEKTFVSGGFKKIDGKYGEFFAISLNKNEIAKLPANEKGYISLNINRRQQADKRGNEYYITLNEWKKDEKADFSNVAKAKSETYCEEGLPF